jgi:hypothetical protein
MITTMGGKKIITKEAQDQCANGMGVTMIGKSPCLL